MLITERWLLNFLTVKILILVTIHWTLEFCVILYAVKIVSGENDDYQDLHRSTITSNGKWFDKSLNLHVGWNILIFYSGDYNTVHQIAKDKEIMERDNREAWFHYAHTSNSMATSQDDVFMPKDSTVILEDGEMNEIDRELEEFKQFCLMIKPLKNHPKVAVQMNLKDLVFKKS